MELSNVKFSTYILKIQQIRQICRFYSRIWMFLQKTYAWLQPREAFDLSNETAESRLEQKMPSKFYFFWTSGSGITK